MKKINLKIFIILIIAFIILPIQKSYAAEASIVASDSVIVGENINIRIAMPTGAVAYSGSVTITYSDGTTNTTKITNVSTTSLEEEFHQVDDATLSFSAKTIGTATIKVTNLTISDEKGNKMNSNSVLSKSVQIQSNSTPEPEPEPEPEPAPEPDDSKPEPTQEEPTFTDVNETVYVKSRVNVRTSYTTSSKSYGLLDIGTELTRTGIGSNGWSRVNYDGKTAYISSSYLTKEKIEEEEPTFTDVNETVYVKSKVNVRASYTTSSESLALLEENAELTRIGIGNNGWSRVKFNGETAYVSSSFLTTEKTENTPEPSETPTPTAEEDNKTNEEKEYQKIVKSVGVLPEVGNNIATYIYFIVLVSTILALVVINKNKE